MFISQDLSSFGHRNLIKNESFNPFRGTMLVPSTEGLNNNEKYEMAAGNYTVKVQQ